MLAIAFLKNVAADNLHRESGSAFPDAGIFEIERIADLTLAL